MTNHPPQPESASEQIEEDMAREARELIDAGKRPTARALHVLKRVDRRRESHLRRAMYETIPKKDWAEMSGRQHKQTDTAAREFGVPTLGPTISLPAVARWLYDFLREKRRAILKDGDGEAMGGEGEAQERYRLAKAKQEEIKLAVMRGRNSDNEHLLAGLTIYFASLRETFHGLQKKLGPADSRDVQDAIKESERKAMEFLTSEMQGAGAAPVKSKRKAARKPRKAVRKK